MINFNRQNFSMSFISCNIILNNGIPLSFKGLSTNINGIKRTSVLLAMPKPNLEYNLNNEFCKYKRNSERCFKALGDIHQRNLQRTRSQFFDAKKILENTKDDEEKKLDDLISQKTRELEYENDIDQRSICSLNDTYMQTEINKINETTNALKKEIDKKYQFKRPNLKIDTNDQKKIQGYMDNIKKLKKYSNNSNYNKVINNFNLNKYV